MVLQIPRYNVKALIPTTDYAHAVTHLGGAQKYWYDENGNQTRRDVGGTTYLSYDAENRLVSASGAATATFVYDGDGKRVKSITGGTTTVYIGNYYEWSSTSIKKYYYSGATRLAMRDGNDLHYLFGDHLGSTSKSYEVSNGSTTTLLYKAWGEMRYSSGTMPTTFHFTGQREQAEIGLYYYGARWYDPALGRFVQADTVIANAWNVQSWDRYAYVSNNPLLYIDPDGRMECIDEECKLSLHPISGNIIKHSGKITDLEKDDLQGINTDGSGRWVFPIADIPGFPPLQSGNMSYCHNCPKDPTNLTNYADAILFGLETGSNVAYVIVQNKVYVYVTVNVYTNGNKSVSGLSISNRSDLDIFVETVALYASANYDTCCVGDCIRSGDYSPYLPNPSGIGSNTDVLGFVSNHSIGFVGLVPSGYEGNPINTFPPTVDVTIIVILSQAVGKNNGYRWPLISSQIP